MSEFVKPTFLLDTGPLSVLCGFPSIGDSYLAYIVEYAHLVLPDKVVNEAGSGKIARVVFPLIKAGLVSTVVTSDTPAILDVAYVKYLGEGERSVIKAGLAAPDWGIVIDDKDAFVVACRFGLKPIGFQDFIIKLTQDYGMLNEKAIEIVTTVSVQFPASYLTHTLNMLS